MDEKHIETLLKNGIGSLGAVDSEHIEQSLRRIQQHMANVSEPIELTDQDLELLAAAGDLSAVRFTENERQS